MSHYVTCLNAGWLKLRHNYSMRWNKKNAHETLWLYTDYNSAPCYIKDINIFLHMLNENFSLQNCLMWISLLSRLGRYNINWSCEDYDRVHPHLYVINITGEVGNEIFIMLLTNLIIDSIFTIKKLQDMTCNRHSKYNVVNLSPYSHADIKHILISLWCKSPMSIVNKSP